MAAQIPGSLEVQARQPLDGKYWVASYSNLEDGLVYNTMLRATKDTQLLYIRRDGVWYEIGSAYIDKGPNNRLDLWKEVRFFSVQDRDSDSYGGTTFEELDKTLCSSGTTVIVEFYRTDSTVDYILNQRLVAVYDGSSNPQYQVRRSGTTDEQLVPAKFVPFESNEAKYGYVRRYELNNQGQPTITDWRLGELCIFSDNGQDNFATALRSGILTMPSSTVDTADWKRAAPPTIINNYLTRRVVIANQSDAIDLLDGESVIPGQPYQIDDFNGLGRLLVNGGINAISFSGVGELIDSSGDSSWVEVNIRQGTISPISGATSYTDDEAKLAAAQALVDGNPQHVGIQFSIISQQIVATVATQNNHKIIVSVPAQGTGNLQQGFYTIPSGFGGYYHISLGNNNAANIELFRTSAQTVDFNGSPTSWPSNGVLLLENSEYRITITPIDVNQRVELIIFI